MWGKRSGFKSPRGSFTHIHLDYVRIEILSCKKKNLYVMCDFSMIFLDYVWVRLLPMGPRDYISEMIISCQL